MYYILDNLIIKEKLPSPPTSKPNPGRTPANFSKKDYLGLFTGVDFLKQNQNL